MYGNGHFLEIIYFAICYVFYVEICVVYLKFKDGWKIIHEPRDVVCEFMTFTIIYHVLLSVYLLLYLYDR